MQYWVETPFTYTVNKYGYRCPSFSIKKTKKIWPSLNFKLNKFSKYSFNSNHNYNQVNLNPTNLMLLKFP